MLFRSGRQHAWGLDQVGAKEVGRGLSGNRDNAAFSGSRASNWNNYPWNSNWNIGLRAFGDDEIKGICTRRCHGVAGRPEILWSAPPGLLRQTHYEVRRATSRALPESRADIFMGVKHKHLFEQIVAPDNLWAAYRKTSLGKRGTLGYLLFRQNEAANLHHLRQAMMDGSYAPSVPRTFMVFEPKQREISALPFVDRIAQHAFCNIIEPIFDKVFMPQSYACRTGRGTHKAGIARFVRYMDDVVVIGHSREAMALLQAQAESFTWQHMGLHFSRWSVQPWQRGVNFCGYRIWPTHKLLRQIGRAHV